MSGLKLCALAFVSWTAFAWTYKKVREESVWIGLCINCLWFLQSIRFATGWVDSEIPEYAAAKMKEF